MGLRTVGTKELFEALGHMAYVRFSTFGVLVLFTFTMPYFFINRGTPYIHTNSQVRFSFKLFKDYLKIHYLKIKYLSVCVLLIY